ncbi:hypothetical protein D3C87_78560 [compost metagenome]
MANNDFTLDTNYNPDAAFTRLKFGINKPILESELNEMQKISEDRVTNFIRQNTPTGFLELVKKDFVGDSIIYNPNGIENSIAIAPARLSLNGYSTIVDGKDVVNGVNGYTIIRLGDAPDSSQLYYNFVYLELWMEELTTKTLLTKNGNIDGETLTNNILDGRVGDETSRRIGLRYKFRVKSGIDFTKWPEGFGFNSVSDYSDIYAQGPYNRTVTNSNYLFINASSSSFRNTPFYNDYGLYVAGRPGNITINADLGVQENYVFALPIMNIKRRNKLAYSSSNPNGAKKYVDENTLSDRPDGLFYNWINPKDVKDFRKTISLGQINTNKMLNENLKKLLNGSLRTNQNENLIRTQFGVKPIETISDSTYDNHAIFHVKFNNQTLTPTLGLDGTPDGNPNYHLAASGYGLSLDGNFAVQYPIDSFAKNEGSVDFYLKPYWNGTDQEISQTIMSINDETGFAIMELTKNQGQLILKLNYSKDATQTSNTIAYLDKNLIYNNEVCHIRFTWLSSINGNESKIYINGNLAALNVYSPSILTPTHVKLGKKGETVKSYSPTYIGSVIDEVVIYNKALDSFIQLENDIISSNANIHSSFNGILSGFKNNNNKQKIVTPIVTTVNGTSFVLTVPYGLSIDSGTVLSVFNPSDGSSYTGSWSNFNNNTATFNLTSPSKFTGETVWVVHNIVVPGGYGIKNIPTKILKATINNEDMSFASTTEGKRSITLVNSDGSIEKKHVGFDYNSNRDNFSAFARTINYSIQSNGTNLYTIPGQLYGREVIGIKSVDKPLSKIAKTIDGLYEVTLIEELPYSQSVVVTVALGGYTFEYETYSKTPISNIMRAATIRIPTTGNTRNYTFSTSGAIPGSNALNPSGGIIMALLKLEGYNLSYQKIDFGTSVFITGDQFNYFANATVTGLGTPIINITFESTPQTGHFIEIPVLVTYQPRSTDIISVWYNYVPYQGTLLQNSQKSLKRLTDWKVFCTTLGSGKTVVTNIKENSINNAADRLPGGQTYSYLLEGESIEFVGEQMSLPVGYSENYETNKKLVFRNQFTELVFNNEYDDLVDSLDTEFTIAKLFGQNHQDAIISSELSNMNLAIQDTKTAINKYIGAACLVIDDQGNILLLIVGDIKTTKTHASIMKPTSGDLFKINGNPMIIARRY